jgi:acyl-CoA reductase-like NAD-dependent aldehyde dehydrogenase
LLTIRKQALSHLQDHAGFRTTVFPVTIGATVVPAMIANKKFHGGITTVTPEESGLPKGVVNFVPGSGAEVGDYLVDHPKTSLITCNNRCSTRRF